MLLCKSTWRMTLYRQVPASEPVDITWFSTSIFCPACSLAVNDVTRIENEHLLRCRLHSSFAYIWPTLIVEAAAKVVRWSCWFCLLVCLSVCLSVCLWAELVTQKKTLRTNFPDIIWADSLWHDENVMLIVGICTVMMKIYSWYPLWCSLITQLPRVLRGAGAVCWIGCRLHGGEVRRGISALGEGTRSRVWHGAHRQRPGAGQEVQVPRQSRKHVRTRRTGRNRPSRAGQESFRWVALVHFWPVTHSQPDALQGVAVTCGVLRSTQPPILAGTGNK